MTGIISRNYQQSEVSTGHNPVRMKFWGVCCVGGKAYKQVVNYRFHLTMAVLDPKSFDRDVRDRTVTLSVIQHGQVFLLCVLRHGDIQQVSLNLIFDKGDDVTFSVGGYGTVHLTGYQLIDSSDSAFDQVDHHYCPVIELESDKKPQKRSHPAVNGVETKSKEKAKSKLSLKALAGEVEEDEEEDDSDFSIKSEEIEIEEESDDEELDEEDIDEDEIKDITQELEEVVTPPKAEGSQKRKAKESLSSKVIKKGKHESELDVKCTKKEKQDLQLDVKEEILSHEESESDEEQSDLDSSIGHTPMPKLEKQTSLKNKKKSKKLKRLSDISMIDKVEKNDGNATQSTTTPKKDAKHPVLKLEGGVEYQDSVIGRGLSATKGKVVSVFYVGRLENKSIFDARVPPKKPFTFKLGVPEVIRGLDIGIQGMRVGGQRKLKIPPGMGYGKKGLNNVPPNSTLYFTIELIAVT